MNIFDHPLPCPECKKIPGTWKEWPRYGSRELYFIGCKPCGHLASACSPMTAGQAWERYISRHRAEHRAWFDTTR